MCGARAQDRLAKQRGALEAIRESEKRAHEGEVKSLKAAFEERCVEHRCRLLLAQTAPCCRGARSALPQSAALTHALWKSPALTWRVPGFARAVCLSALRLTEAVEKVRAVHATNRDAVQILQKNKKLRMEVAKLKNEMAGALEAQQDAAARERQRAEEGAAVVAGLMAQLQEKEALLAAGAGAMSEEEREEMMRKEKQRAQQYAR